MKQLQLLIDALNSNFETGSVSILSLDDGNFSSFGCGPDDVIVYVDFSSDTERRPNQALAEYMWSIRVVERLLRSEGFMVAAENDGSGSGLYYGFTAYRKAG